MTNQEKIEKLKKGLGNSRISESIKAKIEQEIAKLEAMEAKANPKAPELDELPETPEKKPRKARVAKAKVDTNAPKTAKQEDKELKQLMRLIKKNDRLKAWAVKHGVIKDAIKKALPPGKRISSVTGKTYYENRINRSDSVKTKTSKYNYEIGGDIHGANLAGNFGGGAHTPSEISPNTGMHYSELVGETGAMSAGELFKGGGAVGNKKYIPHDQIESITVQQGINEVTYKGSSVLNGVHLFEGGGLSNSATYIKRGDIVQVTLKNGEKIKPKNGYWIMKTPKMARTQFEDEDFEYKKGGPIGKKKEGSPKMKEAHKIATQIRKEGESWQSALKRAWEQLK